MAWLDRMKAGLSKSREKLQEHFNYLMYDGPEVDDDFWDTLEESLIMSDMGFSAAEKVVEEMREISLRKALPDGQAVLETLSERIAATFTVPEGGNPLDERPVCVLLVGVNGSGKTTTAGKMAAEAKGQVIGDLGSPELVEKELDHFFDFGLCVCAVFQIAFIERIQ